MGWLHDETGNIRRELYTCDAADIARLAAEIDARTGDLCPPCTFDVQQGDELLLAAGLHKSWGCDWVEVVRVDRNPIMGPSFLLTSPDGTGGFLGPQHIIGWRRPDRR